MTVTLPAAPTQDLPYLRLKGDFDAAGDLNTDDSAALDAALDALGETGGTLEVEPGNYILDTTVTKSFQNLAANIEIRGHGSASRFYPTTGNADCIVLQGLQDLLIENVFFVGTTGQTTDARRVLSLSSIFRSRMRGCGFYNLSSVVANGAVIYYFGGSLRMEQCQTRGSITSSGLECSVVHGVEWTGFYADGCDWIDYGYLDGVEVSKGGAANPLGWVSLYEPAQTLDASAVGQDVVTFKNCRLDELAIFPINVRPNPPSENRVAHVLVDGCRINGCVVDGSAGMYVRGTDRVTVRNTWVGFQPGGAAAKDIIYLEDAGHVELEGVIGTQTYNRITADSDTLSLTLRDCQYTTLNSDAPVTTIGSSPALLEDDGDLAPLPAGKGIWLKNYNGTITKKVLLSNDGLSLVLVGSNSSAYSNEVAADSPIAYWRLGEIAGTDATDFASDNDGTYVGPTLGVTGAIDSDVDTAVTLDGTNDYILVPDATALRLTNSFTIEAWVKPTDADHTGVIIEKGEGNPGYAVLLSGGYLRCTLLDGLGAQSSTKVAEDVWTHVAVTYDGADLRFYLNGALDNTSGRVGSANSGSSPVYIGKYNWNGAYFKGALDELAVYNTVLTGARLLAHYDAGVT